MTMITPGGGTKVIQLNDATGTDKYEVKDMDGFTVFSIDSRGNLKLRGSVSKI